MWRNYETLLLKFLPENPFVRLLMVTNKLIIKLFVVMLHSSKNLNSIKKEAVHKFTFLHKAGFYKGRRKHFVYDYVIDCSRLCRDFNIEIRLITFRIS